MPKKDPDTELRRSRFRDFARERGWEKADGKGWNTNAVAAAIGKPPNKASDLLNGQGSFGAKIARELEEALGLPKGYFDGIGESDDFIDVKVVNVKLAAGHGADPEIEELIGHLKFTRAFLRNCGVSAASARVVEVEGPSMEPTIKDGAVLLVNTNNREPLENAIFALARPHDGLVVKRLVKTGAGWVARSDNRDYDDIPIDDGEPISIIGRALWMGAKL
jgi:phage repressor protein C with HTH and peptisase S24 domain